MMAAVNEVKCPEEYQMSIDMNDYKRDFAILIAKLESSEETNNEPERIEKEIQGPERAFEINTKTNKQKQVKRKYGKGMVATAVSVTLINVTFLVVGKLLRK